MLFGYFDYLIVAVLLFLNIKYWKRKVKWLQFLIFGGLMFGLLLPIISIVIELEIVKSTTGEWMDSFEVVYTLLRFPTYWAIGIAQLILMLLYHNYKPPGIADKKPAGNNV